MINLILQRFHFTHLTQLGPQWYIHDIWPKVCVHLAITLILAYKHLTEIVQMNSERYEKNAIQVLGLKQFSISRTTLQNDWPHLIISLLQFIEISKESLSKLSVTITFVFVRRRRRRDIYYDLNLTISYSLVLWKEINIFYFDIFTFFLKYKLI